MCDLGRGECESGMCLVVCPTDEVEEEEEEEVGVMPKRRRSSNLATPLK